MNPISSLLAISAVSIIAAASPGPDFFIVAKNSLSFSRRSGLMTALGVSLALIFHLSYTLIGLGILIAETPLLYAVIKYLGVAYLLYIGLVSMISSFQKTDFLDLKYAPLNQQTDLKCIWQGFLTNLLNPKAAVFFISFFSQFVDVNTSVLLKIQFGLVNWVITLTWFILIAYLMTIKGVVNKIHRYQVYIDRVMGGVFMLLALKLLLT